MEIESIQSPFPNDEQYKKMIQVFKETYFYNQLIIDGKVTIEDRVPCHKCGNKLSNHHATCDGENYCHDCYLKYKPVTQLYPGDMGYAPWLPERDNN